ncbi:unnamed protein product, partial [Brachionus calyciflorus]
DNNLKEKLEKKSIQKDFENQLENKANEVAKLVNKNKDEQRKTTEEILGPVLNPKLLDQLKKKAINKANNNIELNEPTIEKLNRNDKEYRNFLKKAENLNEIKKDENVVRREKVDKRKVPFWAESPYQKFQNLSGGNGLALFGSDFKPVVTTTLESPIWSMHHDEQLKLAQQSLPINGFDELIQLTNEGKIWKFPIDNEQGVDESDAGVPFHEHIFLDHYLDEFPQIEPIQQFMMLVLNGISLNSFLTIQEKKDIINWYKTYFTEKLDIINEALEAERLEASYRELSAKK